MRMAELVGWDFVCLWVVSLAAQTLRVILTFMKGACPGERCCYPIMDGA